MGEAKPTGHFCVRHERMNPLATPSLFFMGTARVESRWIWQAQEECRE